MKLIHQCHLYLMRPFLFLNRSAFNIVSFMISFRFLFCFRCS
ncbi:hypothetical protein BCAH1134_C0360 (plasmid) [Bacillus cereus AH1134]|nr:hypothetical protein BCAH1134_C0360 [Bacillus cereus AH1134]